MRAAEARSAQIARPEGVARCFHVSRYKIEPIERARNLLSKDDWRAALVNEAIPYGPEMTLVVEAALLSRGAEGLAGAASRPDRPVVGPACAAQGVAPDTDAREEVALVETRKVFMLNFRNAPLIDFTFSDMACGHEVAQPLGCVGVYLIVIYCHLLNLLTHSSTSFFDHRQA